MLKLDNQTRAILMAMGGAAIAAIVAMFVPVGLWETITGSTGISEMIPATRAPLGDTARALIAFGFGVLTFAILAIMALRGKAVPKAAPVDAAEPLVYETASDSSEDEAPSLILKLKDRVSAFIEARRGASDVSGLEDLPKLRSGDAHPDAPPRRPLLATRDLADPIPTAEFAPQPTPAPDSVPVPVEAITPPLAAPIADPEIETTETVQIEASAELSTASLADMVDRLEIALAAREVKLTQLEALVAEGSAAKSQTLREVPPVTAEVGRGEAVAAPPVLEAVAAAPAPASEEAEEMDAALRSALETLHRMNARTR